MDTNQYDYHQGRDAELPMGTVVRPAAEAVPGVTVVGSVLNPDTAAQGQNETVRNYLEKGEDRQDRIRFFIGMAIGVLAVILVVVLLWKLLPGLTDSLLDLGREIRKDKDDLGVISLCLLISICFNCFTLPGRLAFNLVVCYVYLWWGFVFLWVGHTVGTALAFGCARVFWHRGLDKLNWRRCCCCFYKKDGRKSKAILFILSCLAIVEERPLQMIILLSLSAAPVTLVSYVLGSQADRLPFWKFVLGEGIGGLRLIFPTYIATKAKDMAELVATDPIENPADSLPTILSVVLTIIVAVVISRLAMKELRKAQKKLRRQGDGGSGVEEAGVGGNGTPSKSRSKLSNELYASFSASK